MARPTLAVDFDGVLRVSYKCDNPVHGSENALAELSKTYRIIVHSCRCLTPGGEEDIWQWLSEHGLAPCVHAVTALKPQASAYIDDRAIRFEGDWPATIEEVRRRKRVARRPVRTRAGR